MYLTQFIYCGILLVSSQHSLIIQVYFLHHSTLKDLPSNHQVIGLRITVTEDRQTTSVKETDESLPYHSDVRCFWIPLTLLLVNLYIDSEDDRSLQDNKYISCHWGHFKIITLDVLALFECSISWCKSRDVREKLAPTDCILFMSWILRPLSWKVCYQILFHHRRFCLTHTRKYFLFL